MTKRISGFRARTAFFVLLIAALVLVGNAGIRARAAEGSGAWGASLPEYARVTTYDLVKDGKVDNTGKTDCYKGFQKLLNRAQKLSGNDECIEIYIPDGDYSLLRGLKIYSNTRIICGDDVTVTRCFNGGSILSTAPTSAYGYGGAQNILIQGGTWDGNAQNYGNVSTFSNIRVGHARNILFRGMNIINNKNGHHIEIGGASGVTIDGCSFSGYYGDLLKEAIQLDVMNCESLFAGYSPFDDTACENVVIRNCYFSNLPRAIGSHSCVAGVYYNNVTIADNTFDNMNNYALFLYNYKNCTIRGNTFNSCGAAILFNYMTDESFRHFFPSVSGVNSSASRIDGYANTVISDNNINTVVTGLQSQPFGIKVYGASVSGTSNYPSADYYINDITIKNNKIDTAYCGIILNDVYNADVSGNEISARADSTAGYLISASWVFDSKFTENTISNGIKSGFCAMNCGRITADANTIRSCADVAMLLSAVSDSTITKSGFSDNTLGGVKIDDASYSLTLSKNVIRGGNYGIKVDSSGSGEDIKLKSNDITEAEIGITCVNGGAAYMVGNSFEAVGRKVSADGAGQVLLSKPRAFDAEEIHSSDIKLTWKPVGEADGINIYRKMAGYEEFTLIASGDSGSIFRDEMLEPGTNYVYKAVPYILIGDMPVENTPSDEIGARTKISMDDVKIVCTDTAGFTARPVEPPFSVSYNGRELIPGVDYDYSYSDNLYAGKASLTVTGRGNYMSSQTAEFDISIAAAPLAASAPKTAGTAGAVETRRYEVTIEREPTEILAVSDERVNPIQRAIDSLTIDDPVKLTSSGSVWSGDGYITY